MYVPYVKKKKIIIIQHSGVRKEKHAYITKKDLNHNSKTAK